MPPKKKLSHGGNGGSQAKRSKGPATSASNAGATARRFPAGRRGGLKMLPEMPLDILFEIFSCLQPPDVLRLARTTKALRSLLMSHSAISIWKSAFMNDPDLPGAPDGLSEPRYANLAFSPHCHLCFIAGEHSILWVYRIRLCERCLVGRFDELHKVAPKKLSGLIGNTHLLHRATVSLTTGTRFLYSHEEAGKINEQILELKKGDPEKFEDFIVERKKLVEDIKTHSQKAEMSVPLRQARLQRALQESLDRRKEAICGRLSDLGYAEEVQYIKDTRPQLLSEHAWVKSNSELTERVWDNMKPQLVNLMQDTREKLHRKQRKALLKNRQRLLLLVLKKYNHDRPIEEINPRAIEICVLPHIAAMIENPTMESYTEETFREVLDDLPRFCEEWRDSKTRDLVALIPRHNVHQAFLRRATTFFHCADCSEPIAYPRILAHACQYTLRHGHRNRDDDLALLCQNLDSEPWNSDGRRVSYYPAAEAPARSVVRACGLDTELTTAQDMDDVNPWLACLRCSHKVKGRAIFRWRKAVGVSCSQLLIIVS
ncbi:hypothetical protein B0H15DRAFT_846335 [Mycena belliarum]|uniref:F-box domain-containing protein n=1 Tax=Mycena belliarum TaxID=1033014 RepID=A0AAD6U2B7_9AGAR|nr:hypothetical protein B0H15DRAFT_846335 [Mycena belliae]